MEKGAHGLAERNSAGYFLPAHDNPMIQTRYIDSVHQRVRCLLAALRRSGRNVGREAFRLDTPVTHLATVPEQARPRHTLHGILRVVSISIAVTRAVLRPTSSSVVLRPTSRICRNILCY